MLVEDTCKGIIGWCTPWVVKGPSRGTWEPNSPGWFAFASGLREALILAFDG